MTVAALKVVSTQTELGCACTDNILVHVCVCIYVVVVHACVCIYIVVCISVCMYLLTRKSMCIFCSIFAVEDKLHDREKSTYTRVCVHLSEDMYICML
jgi:hypothetical protein